MIHYQYNLKELMEALDDQGEMDEFIRDIFRFNLICDEHFGIQEVLFDPHIAGDSKMRFVQETVKPHVGGSFAQFLEQLIRNDDINFYQVIIDKFLKLLEKEKGCGFIEVISEGPLKKDMIDRIQKALERLTHTSLVVYNSTSKKVLGGFVVKFGEKVVDLSLQNDLEKLKFSLTHHT